MYKKTFDEMEENINRYYIDALPKHMSSDIFLQILLELREISEKMDKILEEKR